VRTLCDTTLRLEATHPALPGHFPGSPVAPGVVVLDLVLQAAEKQLGASLPVTGLQQVKFAAPLLPGTDAQVVIQTDQDRMRFQVQQSGRTIAQGCFTLQSVEGA
jgi:3-hydroxymyristoyl/3-hydroxydecanoyl-(acyl carrier protein) dehydratase